VEEKIDDNGALEEEIVRIYDKARQNAFSITILIMMFITLISYFLTLKLPSRKASEIAES
jgi:hypothetical protein